MWFMNKLVNPLVRWLLRSPLHRLVGNALLLITYQGRKTGKSFTLPVQFARDGEEIYILPGAPENKTWWRNFKDRLPVQITVGGATRSGTARLLNPGTDQELLVKGLGLYLQQFPALAKVHQVRREAEGRFNADDLRQAAQTLVMIQVLLQ